MKEDKVKTIIKWEVDGKTGEYTDDFGFCWKEDGYLNDFWWTEGNGGCDCNRAKMFFGEDWECGNKIKIISIEEI